MLKIIVVICLSMIMFTTSTGFCEGWKWFSAEANSHGWFVRQGTAVVELTDTAIMAELHTNRYKAFIVSGTRNGDQMIAKITFWHTDLTPIEIPGRYRLMRYQGGGQESILFNHPDYPGSTIIGLTRELP